MLRAATVNIYYCPIVPSSCHPLWSDTQGVNQRCPDGTRTHAGSRCRKTPFQEKGTGPGTTDSRAPRPQDTCNRPAWTSWLSWSAEGGHVHRGRSGQRSSARIPARSHARLVTVEGRDVKHVAVCANPDRFHLTISGQRSRMRGAARAKDLKGQYRRHQPLCPRYRRSVCAPLLRRRRSPKLGLLAQADQPSHSSCSGASGG